MQSNTAALLIQLILLISANERFFMETFTLIITALDVEVYIRSCQLSVCPVLQNPDFGTFPPKGRTAAAPFRKQQR